MKLNRAVGVCVMVLILSVPAFYLFRPLPDPVYRGKPLSVWVASIKEPYDYGINPQVDLVAKQIDSQAIPLLRSYLSARGPTETIFYRRFYSAMPTRVFTGAKCSGTCARTAQPLFRC